MNLHLETRAIHAAAPELNGSRPVSVPIYQTSTFAFADPEACAEALNDPGAGFAYSRYRNPTTQALEDAVADMEGGAAAIATSSGMGAINAVLLALLRPGDHVIAQRCLYGGTFSVFTGLAARYGIDVSYITGRDPAELTASLRPGSRLLFLETIANPTVRGLKTLSLRMDRHCSNAAFLAERLAAHPAVATVLWPGLASHPDHAVARRLLSGYGGMVAFDVTGGREAGLRFITALRLAAMAPSLGGVETLVLHPASTSHRQLDAAGLSAAGIGEGSIRVSVGLEHPEDLWADFQQALAALPA